jgi:hypothetical protein
MQLLVEFRHLLALAANLSYGMQNGRVVPAAK